MAELPLDFAERDDLLNLVDGRAVAVIPCVSQAHPAAAVVHLHGRPLPARFTIREVRTPLIGWSPLFGKAEVKAAAAQPLMAGNDLTEAM